MAVLDAGNRGGVALHPAVVWLSDGRAMSPDLAGAKAANLARAGQLGHAVLPGFVLTTEGARRWRDPSTRALVEQAWRTLSDDGRRLVVVRSSSTIEDAAESSQAGRFTSVLRVDGLPAFRDAVEDVLASAALVDGGAPMAVLVQHWLDAETGGVAFGLDPVTGADDIVVAALDGGPHALVRGDERGETLHLSRHGRVRRTDDDSTILSRRDRHNLAKLVADLGRRFEAPQDVEWAIDGSHRLWLLQNRPITAVGSPPTGPLLGPGPVAETFPEQLAPLEEDLWLAPLRDGVGEALVLAGQRRRAEVERSPVVVSVGGWLAIDLELIGAAARRRRWWHALDPRPGARRVASAWTLGHLRAALPALAQELVDQADHELLDVPSLGRLSDDDLVLVVRNAQPLLRALHGYEVLVGMVLPDDDATSVAAAALDAVARGRARGATDAAIVHDDPVTLALLPPRIGPARSLPDAGPPGPHRGDDGERPATPGELREALRLRVRWTHELTARAAWELAERLSAAGRLHRPECARHLRLDELEVLVAGGPPPPGLRDRLLPDLPPLPASFRLRDDGGVVAVGSTSVAVGAGGGRVEGVVHRGDDPPPGAVLVVPTLSPHLASVLPRISALVAETGSPLSHLAILARELGIATVVGYPDAGTAFATGDRVIVDGISGEVARAGSIGPGSGPAATADGRREEGAPR